MVTLTNPLWVAALAAIVLPLAAHWLARGRRRPLVFPAMRFFLASSQDGSRWQRLRQWVLLAVRMASLAAIALAFAGPILSWADGAAGTGGRDVVVIVDRSASMQRAAGGVSLFDRARQQARAVLARLHPRTDRAAVIMADAHPRLLLPEPTANMAALSARLGAEHGSEQRGRLGEALALAGRVLRDRVAPGRGSRSLGVVLFTDAQRDQWPGKAIALLRRAAVAVQVHVLGRARGNWAVRQVRVRPRQPISGQPAVVTATLANDSAAARRATVRLGGAGVAGQSRAVTVGPWQQVSVRFATVFTRTGMAAVTVTVTGPGDALACDDKAAAVVDVRRALPIDVVTRADVDDANTAAFFVVRALSPNRREGSGPFAVTTRQPESLGASPPRSLPAAAVWVMTETGRLDDAALAAVMAHLRGGGGVLWLADEPTAARNLAALARVAGRNVSPITTGPGGGWQSGKTVRLGAGAFDLPMLSVFDGPGRSALLRTRFTARLVGSLTDGAVRWLGFADGRPALAVRAVGVVGPGGGAGRLAVLAADVRPGSSAMVKGPLFLPLLCQIVEALGGQGHAAAVVRPGERLPLVVRAGQVLIGPDGRRINADEVRAGRAGLYAVVDRRTHVVRAARWVAVDPAESDLRQVPARAAQRGRAAGAGTKIAAATNQRQRVELWPYLMLAALGGLGIEALVAGGGRRG